MSEYQYYEFQALDHPLTTEAQQEMRSLSSRVELTASSASFVYNYGNFRANPRDILAKYFDAMLYITNWGTRQLMFRFPASAISLDVRNQYSYAESLEWSTARNYVILNIEVNEEDADHWAWIEGAGLLSGIAQIRDDLLRGDLRALYLAWLKIAGDEIAILEDDEDLTEPPVPPNLQKLSPTVRNFMAFFDLDGDLVTAAAQASPSAERVDENLAAGIDRLSEDEKRDFLLRLLKGEVHLDITLADRLRELSAVPNYAPPTVDRRTIRSLAAAARIVAQERREKERQQAQIDRLAHLDKVAQQEQQLWARIPSLIEQKKANAYDEAVSTLKDLHDLAEHQNRLAQFQERMTTIRERYPTLRGLHQRLKQARLI